MISEIKMDGRGIEIPSSINNLEELLLHLMDTEIEPDREVVEVRVNGETFSEAYEHQARSVDLQATQSVEILTEDRKSLASWFIKDAPAYTEQMKKGFSASVSLLRDFAGEEKGYKLLAQSVETLRAFLDHMRNVMGLVEAPAKESTREFAEKFHALAGEIITSQEEMDSMLVADLIEYELIPLLDEWEKNFEGRRQEL